MLSRRKLLLETLESRQLLAIDGLGLAGDSLTDEYFDASYGAYAKNWATLVAENRTAEAPMGALGTYPEPRRNAYEYNWARSGADSFSLLTQQQHTSLATDIIQGDVSHAVLAIGQNDFHPSTAAYFGIYADTWTSQQISNYSNDVFDNIRTAIETIDVGDVRLVVSNIIDYGVAPSTQDAYSDPSRRSRVSAVIGAINKRVERFASSRDIPVVDVFTFASDILGPASFQFGGVTIDNEPGTEADNVFVADGTHPHTIASSILANAYLNAFNVGYGEQVPLFSEQEILGIVGLDYVTDTLGFDYSDYLTLPGPITSQVTFSNVSSELDFVHRSFEFQGDGLAGAAWFDYDNDNQLDLFLTNGRSQDNALYRNLGDGTFEDVTTVAGVASGIGSAGVVAGDIDNDGFVDLLLTGDGGIMANVRSSGFTVYHNDGDGTFTDISASSGVVEPATSGSAALADIDNDGFLDLFITAPGSLATRTQHDSKLFHNNGDLTFTDITAASGVDAGLGACATGFSDYDEDGDVDLFVSNCNDVRFAATPIQLFRNDGDLNFTDVTSEAGLADELGFWMATSFADYDNDGDFDLFATNSGASDGGALSESPHGLFQNQGDGTFVNVASSAGVAEWEFGWGAAFNDLDNDGYADLFFTGSLPPLGIVGPGQGNPGRLFFNNIGGGNDQFTEASAELGIDLSDRYTSGVAHGDYNNDGFADIVIMTDTLSPTSLGNPELLLNDGNDNHWLGIQLFGTLSNRDGVGARVTVETEALTQVKEVYAGSSVLSMDSQSLRFGLGQSDSVSRVQVNWPSGLVETFSTSAGIDRIANLVEGAGTVVLPRTTGLFFNKQVASEGYTLFSPNTTTSTYLIDRDGNTVNEWESNSAPGLLGYLQQDGSLIRASAPNGQGGNGTIVAAGSGGLIEQFDWQGNKIWEFGYGNQPGDEVLQHHDFEILPNGNLLLIAWELKTEAEATEAGRDPGLPGQGFVYPDHIVEVQPDFVNGGGDVVWEWHIWDHLVQEFDETKDNWYGSNGVAENPELIDLNYVSTFDVGGGQAEDWTHANGIDYNPDRNEIVLSVREFSEFWVIDHDTTTEEAAGDAGDLLYRWGNPQAYDQGDSSDRVLFYQHDAKWVEEGRPGEGNITVFNNGFGRPGEDFSTVEEIAPPLDTNGDYVLNAGRAFGPDTTVWTYEAPVENFSAIISGTERLSNGNTLITYGVSGTFVEVTPIGVEVWKYVNPHTGAGDIGPTDPVPNAGFNGGGLDRLLTNFTFRAINQELDSIWSVDISASSIYEDTAAPESVVYKLSGIVLENEQSSVQLDLQENGDDLDNFFQAVADAVNQYSGPGILDFDVDTGILIYTGGAGGSLMADLVVPIQPIDDDVFEYKESVEFVIANPFSATGANVKIDLDRSLSTIDILDDDGTALDRYVNKPDSSYAFSLADTIVSPGITTYIVDMTAQTWRTPEEVDKPVWKHWVQIIVPDGPVSDTAVLLISGGSNNEPIPTEADPLAELFALTTNQIVVHLPNVPSEPLLFGDETFSRTEDEIIAYTLDKFLVSGDEEWPLLLPMVKSAVRAMDTAQEFLADNTNQVINDFVVTGASKRGWTTWLTAAVDPRVSGIVPVVIDVLNIEPSIANHKENYRGVSLGTTGGYSDAIHDYTELNIFDRFGTARADQMLEIVDPYSYRDRLTMPKYLLNSTGDPFFTPDSSQFYIDDLIGPTYLRYVPNTGHSLNDDAIFSDAAFIAALDAGAPLPEFNWVVEGGNENLIRVNTVDQPLEVRLWQATNPESLDFRIETFGPGYTSTTLLDQGGGEYVGSVPSPLTGGTAFFVEMTYLVNGTPLKFTTEARIAEPNLDFGDAPVSYGTLLDDDGARHVINDSHLPRLGAVVDSEDDGQPTDNDDVGFDDEDGLQIGTFFDGVSNRIVFTDPNVDPNNVLPDQLRGVLNPEDPAGTDISVWVTGAGILDGWIDFDQSGSFDVGEQVFDSLPVSGDSVSGTFLDLNIKTPAGASDGTTWMRLRISNSGGIFPDGLVIGGEVEDYLVEVLSLTEVPDGQNELPVFDINLQPVVGLPTLDILERDDSVGKVIDDFVINISPGDPTSLDEIATQTVTVSIDPIGGDSDLMRLPPILTVDGQLTVFPAPDAVGTASYRVTVTDDHSTPLSTFKDFEIRINPVNDPPEIDSTVLGRPVVVNPDDGGQSYFVEPDGTIRYAIREDNTQLDGTTEPFFIPLSAPPNEPFGPIGLLDVLTVGPDNESDGTVGGSQSLSLVSPSDENGRRIIGVNVLQLTNNNVIDEAPQISGSNVVWQSGPNSFPFNREIMFFDGTTTTQVTDNDFTDRDPQISGSNVTWVGRTGSSAFDDEIFFWDGTTTTQVTNDSVRDEEPQISGSTVAWIGGSSFDKRVYKWNGGLPQRVTDSPNIEFSVAIDDDNIAYVSDGPFGIEVWLNDGTSSVQLSTGGFNKQDIQVDGDRVVWSQFFQGEDTEIHLFDGTDTIRLTDNDFFDFRTRISGQNIVWWGDFFPNNEIYFYDGVSTRPITDNGFKDINPEIDGDIVVWQGSDGNDDEIFAWDGASITQLTDNDYDDQFPKISGNQVVWQALSNGSGNGIEIFQAELELGYMATDQGGTLTPVFDGSELIGWNYLPPADFHFSTNPNVVFDSFSYEVSDGGRTYDLDSGELLDDPQTQTNEVHFILSPFNDPPVFDIDAPQVGGVPTINLLESDDSTAVSISNFALNIGPGPITAVDEAANQQISFSILESSVQVGLMSQLPQLTSSGDLTIFPIANAFGSATYTVTLTDDHPTDPKSTTKTFTINLQPINDPPQLNPTVVPSSDSDPADTEYGYSVADDGAITYTLREDNTQPGGASEPFFIPLVSVPHRIGLLDVFTVGPPNESDGRPGGSQSLSLTNPTIAITTERGGTLTPVAGGWNYVPPADFNFDIGGVDSFTYEVSDDGTTYNLDTGILEADPNTRTNRVEIILAAVDDAPVFTLSNEQIVVQEDSPARSITNFAIGIGGGPIGTANDENNASDLQTLAFEFVPINLDPAEISLVFSSPPAIDPLNGRLSFQSAADVFGSYQFEIRLRDGGIDDPSRGDANLSAAQLLTINVLAQNDPPVIPPGTPAIEYTLNEDGSVEIQIDELVGVFDPGPMTMFGDESANVTPVGNQTVSRADPIPTTTSAGGTLQLLSSGGPARLLYTPSAHFTGNDTFVYTVTDNGVSVGLDEVPSDDPRTATNTVTLNVSAVNDAPTFEATELPPSVEDAGVVTVENWATSVLAGPLGANDENSGSAAQGLSFQFTQVSGNSDLIVPESITAVIDRQTGTATLSYQLTPDANGTATFETVLRDDGPDDAANGDQNVSQTATITIEVEAVNDPPSFTFVGGNPLSLAEDSGPQEISVIESISAGPDDEGSQNVSLELQPIPTEFASLFSTPPTIDANGILRFTTAPDQNTGNENGLVPIQIRAIDTEGGQSDLLDFQIEIIEINDQPLATSDTFDTDEDTILTFNASELLANDFDPDLATNDDEVVRVQLPIQSQTSGGATLTYDAQTGNISYDPTGVDAIQQMTPTDSVVDSFTYSLIDAAGLISNSVTVSIDVAGINDAPTLVTDTPFVEPEGSSEISVLDNDFDIDGTIDPTTVLVSNAPEFGTVVVTPNGVLIYTPHVGSPTTQTFTYTVADDLGRRSEPSTITVTVNARPIANDDTVGTFLNVPVQIDVTANDIDTDGLDLTSITIVNGPDQGQATVQSDGTVMYVPDDGFTGGDSFSYRVSDAVGQISNVATVTTNVVTSGMQNPLKYADVNADGFVTAIDALLIINHLRNNGSVSQIPVSATDRGPNFYDVNGNLSISAIDALRVVNALRTENANRNFEQPRPPAALTTDEIIESQSSASDSAADLVTAELAGPDKIVDTSLVARVSRDAIDTLTELRSHASDESAIQADVDAFMTDLL